MGQRHNTDELEIRNEEFLRGKVGVKNWGGAGILWIRRGDPTPPGADTFAH